ncbi:hypothetical protein Calag_0610 [Caldisphaera lagunensis DSM 15908]|uniref:Dinitrogenase iron-molybdenum cofactor biosynthesis domain-containing protein n=1 Tax=Caldisphaera lagunensis (strain DSM 15908 / JCM 11604 / ANMR 0165 / IC-154) TaxID=1056495 RepID=L0AB44_CALLD|nr:hypothetical protein [Caldisphaera lagunensis]AFZ70367.1 hypothetical protein Calag_0610 [Caldisphaera lagunensis DSM 15908]
MEKICIPLSDDNKITITSRAKYLAIFEKLNDKPVVIEENPALNAKIKRPEFIKGCIKHKANVIIAAHGSYCSPSYNLIKENNIKAYVSENYSSIPPKFLKDLTMGEVLYSNMLAVYERLFSKH